MRLGYPSNMRSIESPAATNEARLAYDANGVPFLNAGAKVGVYQALATCSGGKVINGDAY